MKTRLQEVKDQMEKDLEKELGETIFTVNINHLNYIDSICIIDVLPEFIIDDKIKVYFLSIPFNFPNGHSYVEYKNEYIGIKCNNKIYKINKYLLLQNGSIELTLKLAGEVK